MNHFISFADSRMTDSLNRLCRQAEALEFFDETTSFTEHDLLPEFTSRMGKYLTPSCKGFGYWSWKPWIISHALQKMKDGDRLLYLDAGCHINPAGMKRFREYVDILDRDNNGMLAFYNGQPEYKWTKGDIFRHFSISPENTRITHSQQIGGRTCLHQKKPQGGRIDPGLAPYLLQPSESGGQLPLCLSQSGGIRRKPVRPKHFFHSVQTARRYCPSLFGDLCGRLGPTGLVSIPG